MLELLGGNRALAEGAGLQPSVTAHPNELRASAREIPSASHEERSPGLPTHRLPRGFFELIERSLNLVRAIVEPLD